MHKIELNGDPAISITWREGQGRTVEVFNIAVSNLARRRGIGTKLIGMMMKEIPEDAALVFAITRISNEMAHQFYESMGWHIIGRLHRFYRDGGDVDETALVYGFAI